MKVAELSGAALDWAVAICEELISINTEHLFKPWYLLENYTPSTDWAQAGPIIEREMISIEWTGEDWMAYIWHDEEFFAPGPLVAAMRCYVAHKLGDEVEVPTQIDPARELANQVFGFKGA